MLCDCRDSPNALEEIDKWLPRLHSLVVGPGLGRDEALLRTAKALIHTVHTHTVHTLDTHCTHTVHTH